MFLFQIIYVGTFPLKRWSVSPLDAQNNFLSKRTVWKGLNDAQIGIEISGRNINNFRYLDDITLMAESEEELKSLLMEVKEKSEKVGLKLNIQ